MRWTRSYTLQLQQVIRRGITPEMSIRLISAFGQNSADLWFSLQNAYDFWQVSPRAGKKLKVKPLKIAA
jgi:plasmid maintenance system antidote protein VapI